MDVQVHGFNGGAQGPQGGNGDDKNVTDVDFEEVSNIGKQ